MKKVLRKADLRAMRKVVELVSTWDALRVVKLVRLKAVLKETDLVVSKAWKLVLW